jgi:tetratricopeptide (TPR) repeat protein
MEVAVQPIETLVVVDDRERLAHALRLARGFALFFVRCNVPAYRAELVAHLKAQLARPVVEVDLEGEPDVYPAVARAAGSSAEDAVLFVYGLEHHLPSGDPERAQQTLRALNWRRAAYQRLERPLAFWLPEYALAMVAREAPDFYDWNSGVFEIEVPQPQREALLADALALPDEPEASLPVEEKRARLRLLEGLWEEYCGESLAERQARLQVALKMARLHESLGDYSQARRLYEESLHIAEELGDRAGVARVLHNLGVLAQQQGDYGQARQFYEESLRISEELGDRAEVASLLHNLGSVLQALGELGRAEDLLALARDERVDGWVRECAAEALGRLGRALGPEHPHVAIAVNNLGSVLQALGDLAGAKACYERALRIDEAAFGPDHPNVARDVNNLGGVLQALGDLAGARECFQRALRIDEAAFGPDHPNVARDVNNLGSVLWALGDLAGARECFQRALGILRQRLPPGHPYIRIVEENLQRVALHE